MKDLVNIDKTNGEQVEKFVSDGQIMLGLDNPDLDVLDMIDTMYSSRERFSTSCPIFAKFADKIDGAKMYFMTLIPPL